MYVCSDFYPQNEQRVWGSRVEKLSPDVRLWIGDAVFADEQENHGLE